MENRQLLGKKRIHVYTNTNMSFKTNNYIKLKNSGFKKDERQTKKEEWKWMKSNFRNNKI